MRLFRPSQRARLLGIAACLALSWLPSAASAQSSPLDRFLKQEADCARHIDLYLVLTRDGRALEIRARGLKLDSIALNDARVAYYRTARHGAAAPPLPALWEVTHEPAAEHRRLIAPQELRPYDEDAAVEPTAPQILPEPPSSYEVGLSAGWELHIVQESRATSFWGQLRQAIVDGWSRLRLHRLHRPPALVLTVSELDGRRLHQLFRVGRKILIDPSMRETGAPTAGG